MFTIHKSRINKLIGVLRYVKQEDDKKLEARATYYQMKNFVTSKMVKVDIVSWLYKLELNVCIVKWEHHIQCFQRIADVLSLPRWGVRTLANTPFVNHGENHIEDWFYRHLLHEVKYVFNYFKPQVPTHKYIDEIDLRKSWRKLILVKTFPQSLYKEFNMWYYDNRTNEVVIVLGSRLKTKFVRVIYTMWLVNVFESENEVLYKN